MSCFITTTFRESPLGDFSGLLNCMPQSLLVCGFAAERKEEVKEWRESRLGELQNVISPDFLSQGLPQFRLPRAELRLPGPSSGAAFVVSTLWECEASKLEAAGSHPNSKGRLEFRFII